MSPPSPTSLPVPGMARLLDWLATDSTSGREAAFLHMLEQDFSRDGLQCTRQPVATDRWNLLAEPSRPVEVLFSTHVDTVPPYFGPTRRDGATHARGACDTKGGLFAMLAAWRGLPPDLRERSGFLVVVGEEVDHCGAEKATSLVLPHLRGVILCEPTRGCVASGQKGIVKLALRATGQAGHSAFPETGHSAIHTLVDALARLQAHPWPTCDRLGPTTLNIGLIAGGLAANIHAPEATAEVLFRTVLPAADMRHQIADVLGSTVESREISANDPVLLRDIPGFPSTVIPFNTDAPWMQGLAPVVLYGPGDIRTAHSPHEHLADSDLIRGIEDYRQIAHCVATWPAARSGAEGSVSQKPEMTE